jgi:hypothetical protein
LWQKTWTIPKKFKEKWERLVKKSDEKDNETENRNAVINRKGKKED